ncbi:YsnF/AvaK domain-containing protein [Paenibacillus sp. LMG 31459]|uniref:YsnF/AvaK domain-containing protein n=1 Tax=Paenibacillus phytohabitans TaxID=2654978 RepID=A0ABX1YF68_9BACL|nr:YsnF/AvaK domain-containing protein [Paenibacillus phytohabitans]NOU79633.1 YsnF/AvaK domain-containing protein [Paenibacillus phytohabitans]
MNKKIVGVFYTEHEASRAIEDLKSHGFLTEDISVIARNKRDVEAISDETGTKAPEGMASGAATGGILGGVTGLLAGIGALAIPGIGPIIAAGPIAATLTGVAVGAGTGGLVGGLIGLGIPEDEAESYDNYVNEGRILVMVDADNTRASDVYSIFRNHNSANADRYMDDPNTTGDAADTARHSVTDTVDAAFNGSGLEGRDDTGLDTMNSATEHDLPGTRALDDVNRPGMTGDVYSGTPNGIDGTLDSTRTGGFNDLDEDRKLRLREEQLDVSKNKVQTGEVNVHKEIIEEQKTINVPVTHEEIVIERRAVNNDTTAEPVGADETIRIPVSEEQVEVRKNTVVTGEVEIHKREIQGTEQVQDTVRREEARVDKSGDVKVDGSDELLRDHSRSR